MNILRFIALSLLSISYASAQESYKIKNLKILEVNSSINPATANYLESNLKKSKDKNGDAALIKLDTPGGLVSTTKDIITLIGSLDIPVFIWITPEGASATSAGAIIASASHLLFMSEGTNIGAATPVKLGEDIKKSDGRDKAINDLVALVKSLSIARGRNSEKFELMISKAKSFDAQTAKKEKIVDSVTNNLDEFIEFIQNKKIKVKGKELILSTSEYLEIKTIAMDPGQSILNIFSNPMTAYILFIIGAALIYFELQAPGGFIAGGVGVFCLVIAAIGFQVLPLNYGALGLIVLSFALFLMEAYITSYGILTISGLTSLVFGSLFLFRTENAYLDIHLPMVLSVVAAILVYVIFIGIVIFKSRGKKENFFENTDLFGHITNLLGVDGHVYKYQVKVNGEIWNAEFQEELKVGDQVKVIEQNNNLMKIKIQKV